MILSDSEKRYWAYFLNVNGKIEYYERYSLNALVMDKLLEYARLALDGEIQARIEDIDDLEVW